MVAHLPSYYKLTEEAMKSYFLDLADQIQGPMMIYNISATTHMSIPIELIIELSAHPKIVGLKDSERDLERIGRLLELFRDRPDFSYQLGWAAQSSAFIEGGGDGIVPSTANAFPNLYYQLYTAVRNGERDKAQHLQSLTNHISGIYQKDKLLSEALPGLKVILEYLEICQAGALAPCYAPSQDEVEAIRIAMDQLELS